jgi:hypothetical protein
MVEWTDEWMSVCVHERIGEIVGLRVNVKRKLYDLNCGFLVGS